MRGEHWVPRIQLDGCSGSAAGDVDVLC